MYGDGMQVRDWLHVDRPRRGHRVRAPPRRVRARPTTSPGGHELPNREVIGRLLAATGRDWSLVRTVPGPARPRPPLRDGRLEAGGARLGAAGRLRGRPARRPSPGTATTRTGSRAPVAATGTPTTRASTATGSRPAQAVACGGTTRAGARADRCASRSPAPTGRLGRALIEALEEAPFTGHARPDRLGPAGARPRHAHRGTRCRAPRRAIGPRS